MDRVITIGKGFKGNVVLHIINIFYCSNIIQKIYMIKWKTKMSHCLSNSKNQISKSYETNFTSHFLLKCLYQASKVSSHIFVCWWYRFCLFLRFFCVVFFVFHFIVYTACSYDIVLCGNQHSSTSYTIQMTNKSHKKRN
jgi:hypothetical protein